MAAYGKRVERVFTIQDQATKAPSNGSTTKGLSREARVNKHELANLAFIVRPDRANEVVVGRVLDTPLLKGGAVCRQLGKGHSL